MHSINTGAKSSGSKSAQAIRQAEAFLNKVTLKGGDITQARRHLRAAKARAGEDAEVLAMAAARRAIAVAKMELTKTSHKNLAREGRTMKMDVDLAIGTYGETDIQIRDLGEM
ncbi:MAG: hypothetical protein GY854_08045 [Deltaproteobacteria bacterium]|nr:hypothetical protein [Deltaproteobacteria bacterium]